MLLYAKPASDVSLREYFRERLGEYSERLKPPPHEDTRWYLGDMLARFGDSEQVFIFDRGQLGLRPLALLYSDAREASSEHERCLILRQLGDLALFIGALFPESYARRGINKDYFIGMGGGAYDYLAENAPRHRHVFAELATAFGRMLQLVSQACSKQHCFDASDILALYQRWRHSGDPLAEQQLNSLGINLETSTHLQ